MTRARQPRNARVNYVADFETTTNPLDCRVWSWGFVSVDNPDNSFEWGIDIESFFVRVGTESSTVYFHNLAFDGSFILDWLLNNGFTHVEEKAQPRQFETLISKEGVFYSITVVWANGYRTEFRDSLKLIPMTVAAISTAYALGECKGDIDYDAPREVGYVPSEAELDYLRRDVAIVAQALEITFREGMTKLTVGSNALAEYKRLVGSSWFIKTFPVLTPEMDDDIRLAYRGGWTYAAEKYRGKVVGDGMVFDVNSLYPSVMFDRVLPWGAPERVDGLPRITEEYPLFIVSITFTAKLRKNHVPCIQIKNSPFFVATDYQTNIVEPVTMSCTNVDLDLWKKHYHLDILAINGAWRFHGAAGMFHDYIQKWSKIKEESSGGLRTIAKLHLNSLYGKFATNPDVQGKIPTLDNGILRLVKGPEKTRDPIYTAMGCFITAYARQVTVTAAQNNFKSFAYADTDSIHLVTTKDPIIDEHPSRMGAWKKELTFDKALFAHAKCYIERDAETGECVVHVAGLPRKVAEQLTFEDFKNGREFDGKLVPRRVPGGVVLEGVSFTLNM